MIKSRTSKNILVILGTCLIDNNLILCPFSEPIFANITFIPKNIFEFLALMVETNLTHFIWLIVATSFWSTNWKFLSCFLLRSLMFLESNLSYVFVTFLFKFVIYHCENRLVLRVNNNVEQLSTILL